MFFPGLCDTILSEMLANPNKIRERYVCSYTKEKLARHTSWKDMHMPLETERRMEALGMTRKTSVTVMNKSAGALW